MRKLLQLLIDNRGSPRRFEVKAQGDEAEIFLYDIIVSDEMMAEWFGGVAPEPFIKALREIKASTIHLRINSPGGDVFAARAIEQALREHPANVIAHIDGYAASAATIIAMAADEIEMTPGAFFMIHRSHSVAYGNFHVMLDTASLLEKVDGTIAETYRKRTGKKLEDLIQWMDDETWFTAAEAKDAGFVDRVGDDEKVAGAWNLGVYARAPKIAPPTPTHNRSVTDHLRRHLELAQRIA